MSYQTPRGTYDILPDEMNRWHHAEEVIRETTKRYRSISQILLFFTFFISGKFSVTLIKYSFL